MPVLVFITTVARNIYCKKNWTRYDEYAYVFMQSNCHSCQITNPEFLNKCAKNTQVFFLKKYVHWEPSCYKWMDEQTDKQALRT
jgi:hypothetical protein